MSVAGKLEVKHVKDDKNDYSIDNVVVITSAGALTTPIKHLKTSLPLFRADLYLRLHLAI